MASTFATFAVRRFLLRFSSSPRFGRDHSALIISGFLRPFRCLNSGHHSFSYSTHRTLSPGIEETTNWAQIDENGLHDLMGAHIEWKREKDAELLKRSQLAKLDSIRNLHNFLLNGPTEPSPSVWHPLSDGARDECDKILYVFEKGMAEEMDKIEAVLSLASDGKKSPQQSERELDAFKKLYLRVLFRLFRELYRQSAQKVTESGWKGVRRQRAEKAQVDQMNAAFAIVPEMTELKRRCFLGALWLADGQSFRFFDFLNTTFGSSSLDGPHINYICHIAIAAKEPAVLEPLIEMTTFFPSNFLHLAKVFNSLALLYGQTESFDKLEQLWRKLDIMKRKLPYREQSNRMKPILARIAHFYRTANRKAPDFLQVALKRLGGQPYFISTHAKKRERMGGRAETANGQNAAE